jgi:Kef-type K+ transport system membrane component KefB
VPAAYLTGRLKKGEPQRMEALGVVFLTAGLALLLDLSYLMAGMTAGILVANLAKHHTVAFHELESFQWPFMVIFFILAGATADLAALWIIGPVGAVFVLARVGGRIIGGWGGSALSGDPRAVRPLYGAALMPQAGVAIGMALVAVASLPDMRNIILPVTIGATILFEIVGPVLTGWAIARADRHEDAKTLSGTSGNSV